MISVQAKIRHESTRPSTWLMRCSGSTKCHLLYSCSPGHSHSITAKLAPSGCRRVSWRRCCARSVKSARGSARHLLRAPSQPHLMVQIAHSAVQAVGVVPMPSLRVSHSCCIPLFIQPPPAPPSLIVSDTLSVAGTDLTRGDMGSGACPLPLPVAHPSLREPLTPNPIPVTTALFDHLFYH